MPLSKIIANSITDGAITNTQINASASIAQSKMEALTTANLPSGTPKYMVMAEVGTNTNAVTSSTSYVDVGISITMPSAVISSLSKIWIRFDGTMRVDKQSHAFADILVTRTAPSTLTYDPFTTGVVNGGTEVYDNAGGEVLDDSLGSGDHTYKIQVRKSNGNSTYASNIYYRYRGWRATLIGF